LLPRLAEGDVTGAAARIERLTLRNAAVDMLSLYEDQAGASGGARDEADRLWPAIVAAQRLAFRILGACWDVEAGGTSPIDGEAVAALDLQLALIRRDASTGSAQPGKFLQSEIVALSEALKCYRS